MKKILLILLIGFSGIAQETKFSFSPAGFTDYVVIKCEGKNKEDIYKKVIDWISVTYNNPKEVIKAEILNDYIRFEGTQKGVPLGTFMGMDTVDTYRYQIEVSVKDEKYKFDVINIENYTPPSQYISGGWNAINIVNLSNYYKNDKIKTSVKYLPTSLPAIFNTLNESLYNFIQNNEVVTKKNEW